MKPRTAIRLQLTVGVIFGILVTLGLVFTLLYATNRKSVFYTGGAAFFVLNVISVLLKKKTLAAISFCGILLFYLMHYLFHFFGSLPETGLQPVTQIGKILGEIAFVLGVIMGIATIGQGYFGLLNLERLDKTQSQTLCGGGGGDQSAGKLELTVLNVVIP